MIFDLVSESGFVTCGPLMPGRYSSSLEKHIQYFDNSKYFQIDKNIFQFCILANSSKKKILRVFSSVGVKSIIVRRPRLGEAVNAASINADFEYLRHYTWVIECKKAESKKLEKWGKELFVWTSEKIQNKVLGRVQK